MKIQLAGKKHNKQILNLLEEAYNESLHKDYLFYKNKIAGKKCIITLEKEKVVGALVFVKDWSHYGNYVSDIAVSLKYRRRGIAGKLFKKFFEISRKGQPKKQPYVFSSTVITNKVSQKMHANLGFEKMGIFRKLHFGEDEVFYGYKIR